MGSNLSAAHQFQQFNQLLQLFLSDVAKHLAALLFDWVVHFAEKLEPSSRYLSVNDAAIVFGARALDEATILQAIEQTRNVGIVRDHALADLAAGQTFGLGAAKDTQRVVLCSGESEIFEPRLNLRLQRIGCPHQRKIG